MTLQSRLVLGLGLAVGLLSPAPRAVAEDNEPARPVTVTLVRWPFT